MNQQKLLAEMLRLSLVVLLLAACGIPAATPVPSTPTPPILTPKSTAESREVVLTFDGETCHYDGPTIVTEGDLTVVLNNQTDLDASLWSVRLDEGKTWQDMLDYIGAPGSSVEPPEWSGSIIMTMPPDNPNARIFTLRKGLYVINCCTCNEMFGPRGVWLGAALEVRAK